MTGESNQCPEKENYWPRALQRWQKILGGNEEVMWGGSKLLHSTDVSQQNQYLPNAAPEKNVTWILGEVLSPKQQGTFDILRHMLPKTVSRFIRSHRQTWP